MSQFNLTLRPVAIVLFCLLVVAGVVIGQSAEKASEKARWTDDFDIDGHTFSSTGVNRFFKLLPNFQLVLEGMEDEDSVMLIVTVLNETAMVDGIEVRVVEERESANGLLVEISCNYFGYCEDNGSVFYFGEDVDIYEDGKVVSHGGSWRAGESGFRAGLMMPGLVLFGASYYQELAPGVAMDRARITNTDTTFITPAGTFDHCLVTEETSLVEPNSREFKIYAPGVGLIKDGALLLTSYGMIDE